TKLPVSTTAARRSRPPSSLESEVIDDFIAFYGCRGCAGSMGRCAADWTAEVIGHVEAKTHRCTGWQFGNWSRGGAQRGRRGRAGRDRVELGGACSAGAGRPARRRRSHAELARGRRSACPVRALGAVGSPGFHGWRGAIAQPADERGSKAGARVLRAALLGGIGRSAG